MAVQLSPQLQLGWQLTGGQGPGQLHCWGEDGFMEQGGPKVFKSLSWGALQLLREVALSPPQS